MKTLQWLFGLTILLLVACDDMDEEEMATMQKLVDYINTCIQQENASEDDARDLVAWTIPGSREGQCMVACIAESIGIIKEGKFSPEGTVEAAETYFSKSDPNKEEMVENLKKAAGECQDVEVEDRCDLALEINDCLAG